VREDVLDNQLLKDDGDEFQFATKLPAMSDG
jgi:hypothetical protein